MMIRTRRSLLLTVVLAACSVTGPSDERDDLRRNRERWNAQRILSYEYVLQQSCFCPPELVRPVRVVVREGQVVSVADAERSTPLSMDRSRTLTVDELFARIQDALDRDAAEVRVQYHPELGYPTSISIDYSRRVIDEELSFTAGELRRVE